MRFGRQTSKFSDVWKCQMTVPAVVVLVTIIIITGPPTHSVGLAD